MARPATLLALVVLAATAAAGCGQDGVDGDPLVGRVAAVLDGDTIDVDLAAGRVRVRLVGVDAPEIAHGDEPAACGGDAARVAARAALDGRRVRLVVAPEPVDRFGRTLASVRIVEGPQAGLDLARHLAGTGHARPLPIPPNTGDAPALADLVASARRLRLGLWGACGRARAFPDGD